MSTRNYSDTKAVTWLRHNIFKIRKPKALGWGEWGKWEEELKKNMPVGHFFTETLPDLLEWIPEHSIDYLKEVGYYISNIRNSSHSLTSNLKKGKYHSFNEVMLHSLFDSYIDYIEIEEAYSHISWSDKEAMKKYNIHWYQKSRVIGWFYTWRCPQAGIDHLRWEMTLDAPDPSDPYWLPSSGQANAAREKMALYTWWKDIRPERGEAWVVSGMDAFWKEMDKKYGEDWLGIGGKGKLTPAEISKYRKLSNDQEELEKIWGEQDEAMMIRLIKIRNNLWT